MLAIKTQDGVEDLVLVVIFKCQLHHLDMKYEHQDIIIFFIVKNDSTTSISNRAVDLLIERESMNNI